MIRAITAIAAAALLMGPLSDGARGPAKDLARIYVYIQTDTPARSWSPIYCDRALVAKLKRGRFFALDVAPGRHMLSGQQDVPVLVDARAGEESFVSLGWRSGDTGGALLPAWHVVDPDAAEREMKYLKYVDADEIISSSVSKKDPRPPPGLRRRNIPAGDE